VTRAIVIAGLGFGDEGKGTITDFLVSKHKAHTVVRYNGGAQAAHNVVVDDKHHTFSQFGAGTLAGAATYLSRFMLVEPRALLKEAEGLQKIGISNPLDLMYIDEEAIVTLPYHVAANRIREEARSEDRHGSCGMGIGETMSDALQNEAVRIKNLLAPDLYERLNHMRRVKRAQLEKDQLLGTDSIYRRILFDEASTKMLVDIYRDFAKRVRIVDQSFLAGLLLKEMVIFEGAQGALLDEDYGFYPHNTWTNTRFDHARTLLKECSVDTNWGNVNFMGIMRTYATRHGPGPFPTHTVRGDDAFNVFNQWQREMRYGFLDTVLLRYALDLLNGVNTIAVTHLDQSELVPQLRCISYDSEDLVDPTLFERNGTKVIIPPYTTADAQLEWQTKLTAELFRVQPISEPFRATAANIESLLDIPVTVSSFGPDRKSKIMR
jgi:adenylosuccinate synthase